MRPTGSPAEAGLAADPADRDAISGALDALASAERRREISAAASRLFAERFAVARVGPAFTADLKGLL